MKMRARKRYNDAWQVGRELFRLNRRLRGQLMRCLAAFPANADLMDYAGHLDEVNDLTAKAVAVPRRMLRDPGKSNIQFWAAGIVNAAPRRGMTDMIWVDEAPSLTH